MSPLSRRDLFRAGIVGVGAIGASQASAASTRPAVPPADPRLQSFHYDHTVGTSLDGWVFGDGEKAGLAALSEIDRLNLVFSPHDPSSELGRFNHDGLAPTSQDFYTVHKLFESWSRVTGGVLSPRMAPIQHMWQDAAAANRLPTQAEITATLATVRESRARGKLTLNSVAKGYILHRAGEAAKSVSPQGGMVDLGGDLVTWGDRPFTVGIANPSSPFDNASPLTAIAVQNLAVATSGGYLRGYDIAGRHYSHILDPRTGLPADAVAQATVIAPDATTANALATACCVLDPRESIRIIESLAGVECLIVPAEGPAIRSSGFANFEVALEATNDTDVANETETETETTLVTDWLKDYQVTVSLEIVKFMGGGRYRRPYVAVWVENSDDKIVRTLAVWGRQPRWLPELTGWWKLAKSDQELVKSVTKATRSPGKYDVVWDGKNDKGKALPQGKYTIKVEVNREHGKHLYQSGKINCEGDDDTITLEKNAEMGDVIVTYGKKTDKKPEDKKTESQKP
ncbi:MAG: DUF2271 domain-containing protein [Gemmataceae bacterium]